MKTILYNFTQLLLNNFRERERERERCCICSANLIPFEAKLDAIFLKFPSDMATYKNQMTYICPVCFAIHNIQAHVYKESDQIKGSNSFYRIHADDIENSCNAYIDLLSTLCEVANIALGGKTFLDIGCGQGFSLFAAKKLNAKNIIGIDIATKNISAVWAQLSKKFQPAWQPQLYTNLDQLQELADVILCWHTLEHIKSPLCFMKTLAVHTALNGILFIQVPQYVQSYIVPAHVIFYSLPTILYLAQKTSFELIGYANDTINQFSTFILRKI